MDQFHESQQQRLTIHPLCVRRIPIHLQFLPFDLDRRAQLRFLLDLDAPVRIDMPLIDEILHRFLGRVVPGCLLGGKEFGCGAEGIRGQGNRAGAAKASADGIFGEDRASIGDGTGVKSCGDESSVKCNA